MESMYLADSPILVGEESKKEDDKVAFRHFQIKFCNSACCVALRCSAAHSIIGIFVQDPTAYATWWPPHGCKVAKEASADAPKAAMACEAKAQARREVLG